MLNDNMMSSYAGAKIQQNYPLDFLLDDCPAVFAIPDTSRGMPELIAKLGAERVTLQHYECSSCLFVRNLAEADLEILQLCSSVALVLDARASIEGFPDGNLIELLAGYHFKIFFPYHLPVTAYNFTGQHALISGQEFLRSNYVRLLNYPQIGGGLSRHRQKFFSQAARAVFVIDLIQDFEILRPLLLKASIPFGPLKPIVALSERIIKYGSYLLKAITDFLEVFNIPRFTATGPVDIANALGGSHALLVTASESNAAAHALCHQACLIAPPKTIRITIQHGYECIGLRHHRAHDFAHRNNPVRFASDIILTWSDTDSLPNLHPMERHKCIPVGVVKQFTEEACISNEGLFPLQNRPHKEQTSPVKLLIAENLHSVRFSSRSKYSRLLNFINETNESEQIALTIRSHPAAQTLETKGAKDQYCFLKGPLSAGNIKAFDAVISPPSTILLDAVIAGVPALVWTECKAVGDCVNYDGLSGVADFSDLLPIVEHSLENELSRNFAWALRNTSALNGIPAAWNAIVNLSRR